MNRATAGWLAAALGALAGCSTMGIGTRQPTVTDVQLAGVSQQDLAQIQTDRDALAKADKQVTDAKDSLDQTKRQRDVGKAELDQANAELKQEKLRQEMETGRGGGQVPGGAEGTDALGRAQMRVNAGKAMVDYMDQLVDVRSRQVSVHEAETDLARAKVELAKWNAAEKAGNVPDREGKGPRRDEFTKSVDDRQKKLTDRRRDLQSSLNEATQKYSMWTALDRALPQGTHLRVQVPAPPKG